MVERLYRSFSWLVFWSLVLIAIAFLMTLGLHSDGGMALLGCLQALSLAAVLCPRTSLPLMVKPLVLLVALFVM